MKYGSFVLSCWFLVLTYADSWADEPVKIGSRLEPFIDHHLIESLKDARLVLHKPVAREIAIDFDRPWEGNTSAYPTVFKDGATYRMYYRGSHFDEKTKKSAHTEFACYAESKDGIHWAKPELGLVEFEGSKANNIILNEVHNFAPFKDANPDCTADARYKALAGGKGGLKAYKSPDGIRWSPMRKEPVITEGHFDSQNLAFFDTVRGRYVEYHRKFHNRIRDIMTGTSNDFLTWTDPVLLNYPGSPTEHLYTNQITPYHRAPHIFMGFPMRFLPSRNPSGHSQRGVSDGVFMTSRDGLHFHRWGEALIRPGLQPSRWVNRNNMTAWGIVETKSAIPDSPNELSIYSSEGYYRGDSCQLRRYTVRLDGFVSVQAPLKGGEIITKPLLFQGDRLVLNYSTSAAGSIRVELQEIDGKPIDGFTAQYSDAIFGDNVSRFVTWKENWDVSRIAGRPLRVRFILKDADLYSMRFGS